ncbi:MAG: BRCT domain-containing protein, partial [Pseudomonadota bacterium]
MTGPRGIFIGKGDRVTLFGRFEAVPKKRLSRLVSETGAKPLRDLTRASTHLVVGVGALSAFDG